jgi:hypothetical protein
MEATYVELVEARQYCCDQVDSYTLRAENYTVKNKKYFQLLAETWQIRMGEIDGLIEKKLKAKLFV